jgi:hypothetical protein
MYIIKYYIIVKALIIFISCDIYKTRYEYFIVMVDSLYVPSIISHNDKLKIELYGLIGTNGCYSF